MASPPEITPRQLSRLIGPLFTHNDTTCAPGARQGRTQ